MGERVFQTQIMDGIIRAEGQHDLREIEVLSPDEKYHLVIALLEHCAKEPQIATAVLRSVGPIIPWVPSAKRYVCLVKLIDMVQNAEAIYDKDIYDVLDFSVVKSLQPLELLSLANRLSDYLQKSYEKTRETALWGLIRVIPYMHDINQKEYAQEVFLMSSNPDVCKQALEALIHLMFNLDLKSRLSLIHFFADILKTQNGGAEKVFVLKLLQHVTPTLPVKDRVVMADCVAPLLYYADGDLVKMSLDYFGSVISLMPESQRYHYTQLVAGMVNDLSVRLDVLTTIEKVLAFLPTESEKSEFRDLLRDYGRARDDSHFDVARASLAIEEED